MGKIKKKPKTESMNYLYKVIALTANIRQMDNATGIKSNLSSIYIQSIFIFSSVATRFVRFASTLISSTVFYVVFRKCSLLNHLKF